MPTIQKFYHRGNNDVVEGDRLTAVFDLQLIIATEACTEIEIEIPKFPYFYIARGDAASSCRISPETTHSPSSGTRPFRPPPARTSLAQQTGEAGDGAAARHKVQSPMRRAPGPKSATARWRSSSSSRSARQRAPATARRNPGRLAAQLRPRA